MSASLKGCGCRRVFRLIALVLCSWCVLPGEAAAQDLLPPGPGWTAAGPVSLIDPASPTAAIVQAGRKLRWWLAVSRPFCVAGLTHGHAAVVLTKRTLIIGASWRQLAGDGLRHIEAELSCGLPLNRAETLSHQHRQRSGGWEVRVGAGLGFQALSGAGVRRFGAGLCRLTVAAVWDCRWRAALMYRGGLGHGGGWIEPWLAAALGVEDNPFSVRAGGQWSAGGAVEPALVVIYRAGCLRFDVGAWGVRAAPAVGLHLVVKELCWSVEGRWVPGPGAHLLWSLSSPCQWEP